MEDLDIEIEAVEELINLQKNKVELLRRKRHQLDQSQTKHQRDAVQDTGVELNQRLSHGGTTGKATGHANVIETVTNVISKAIHEDDLEADDDRGKEEEYNRSDDAAKSNENRTREDTFGASKERGTISQWLSKKEKTQQKEERFVDALTRLSRLTTDLANERTYLAWIRTALASARTVVSFLALDGVNQLGRVSARTCVISFAVLALLMMFQGTERYRKIKEILLTKDTPAGFSRLTTLPISLALLAVFALAVFVTSTDKWVN